MNSLDWLFLIGTLLLIIIYGIWKTRKQNNAKSYIKGGDDKWLTVGLGVMATQASAITFLSATGQGFESGMSFIQFYFGLPIAIVVICIFFIPAYYKSKAYTAYEFLEGRFGMPTRLLTAFMFLISRSVAAGITIYAPSIVLSTALGWNLSLTNLIIGVLVVLYTVSGGTKAVSVTQKQQMTVILLGMFIAFLLMLDGLPEGIGLKESVEIAGQSGRMNLIDLSFDPNNRYTLWSGLTGGFFLMLSYFGTDQSQVQRYLSGANINQSKFGLIFNGLLKLPMQFFILFCGVLLFVFFQFNPSPIHFNQQLSANKFATSYPQEFEAYNIKLKQIQAEKSALLLQADYTNFKRLAADERNLRAAYKTLLEEKLNIKKDKTKDTDYVFLHFILHYLPHGLIGLLLAVILCAAMSSTSGELNSLAATTVVDYYNRLGKDKSRFADIRVSRAFTVMWGIVAIAFAQSAQLFENLIQMVNILGSLFYGPILGVFLCALMLKQVSGKSVFYGLLFGELVVFLVYFNFDISFLWLNPLGCFAVMAFALIFSRISESLVGRTL